MSNSPLVDFTHYSPHHSGKKQYPITRITPHHVVGLCSVEALGKEFDGERQASSNYGIGSDGRIGLYVDECNRAWTSGSFDNDSRAITVECSNYPTYPYEFPEVVYKRLVDLCVDICKRYGKTKLLWFGDKDKALSYQPADDEMVLTIHRWFANTACPGQWLMEHLEDLAEQVTARLREWNFTGDSTPAAWSKEAVEWAVENGIMVGANNDLMLRSDLTREQFCVMLKRFYDLFCASG